VTTHVLSEAELMADRIAIMRRGRLVVDGTPDELRQEAGKGRRFSVRLARAVEESASLSDWLRQNAVEHELAGDTLAYTLPWAAVIAHPAALADALQTRPAA